eukprot:scaffold472_cov264-Pinguiococcus_pyrenoidosus.AAC.12
MHEALTLASPAPCGATRGIIATSHVPSETTVREPLIVVPESLEMNGLRALSVLEPLVPEDVLERVPLRTLDDGALVTLFLAHERAKAEDSFYRNYVESLPPEPPSAWAMEDVKLLQAISMYGAMLDTKGWVSGA